MVARERQGDGIAAVAQGDQARLQPKEPLLDDDPGPITVLGRIPGRVRGRVPGRALGRLRGRVVGQGGDRAFRRSGRVADRHALAGRQTVRLDHDAVSGRGEPRGIRDGRGRVRERRGPGHPDTGRRGDLVTERLARLDPGRGGGRPEDGEAGLDEGIRDADCQRPLGSDDDQLDSFAARNGDNGRGVKRVHARHAPNARFIGDRVAAGRHDDLVHARLRRQLPGQGVFPATAAHDEDPGRHDQAHAGKAGRWRIGRQARSMVWVRSGPTETRTIGTAAYSSIADT